MTKDELKNARDKAEKAFKDAHRKSRKVFGTPEYDETVKDLHALGDVWQAAARAYEAEKCAAVTELEVRKAR